MLVGPISVPDRLHLATCSEVLPGPAYDRPNLWRAGGPVGLGLRGPRAPATTGYLPSPRSKTSWPGWSAAQPYARPADGAHPQPPAAAARRSRRTPLDPRNRTAPGLARTRNRAPSARARFDAPERQEHRGGRRIQRHTFLAESRLHGGRSASLGGARGGAGDEAVRRASLPGGGALAASAGRSACASATEPRVTSRSRGALWSARHQRLGRSSRRQSCWCSRPRLPGSDREKAPAPSRSRSDG